MSEFRDACRAYNREVDRVAAGLVRNGMAPWDAMATASRMVQMRRAMAGNHERGDGDSWARRLVSGQD
jgi:hypothetical protein